MIVGVIPFLSVLFSSFVVVVGDFKKTKVEKICYIGSGIPMISLYVQYCKSVEQMEASIFYSIIFFILFRFLHLFFNDRKEKWKTASYFSTMCINLYSFPMLFFLYTFFSKVIGFSSSFCLNVTSIFVAVIALEGIIEEF